MFRQSEARKQQATSVPQICGLCSLLLYVSCAAIAQRSGPTSPPGGSAGSSGVGAPAAQQSQAASQASLSEAATQNLQKGTELTRQGQFAAAIPLLQAAQAAGIGGYPGGFNLALAYFGAGEYPDAVAQLKHLESIGRNTAAMNNLMAQAYLAEQKPQEAWVFIQQAARLAPTDEKMYDLLMNACTDHYEFQLGLDVSELGLQSLPDSARLHYERAVFLARLDRLEQATPEFARAAVLAPETDLGYLALVQERLYRGNFPEAIAIVRKAVSTGHRDYQMLSLLGTVLMKSGITPADPEFAEARSALERSVALRQDYPSSQIALGKLYLMEGRAQDAIAHLELGRTLEPQNPAVYTSLAAAYRKTGNKQAAEQSLRTLSSLLREKAAVNASLAVHQ